METWWCVDHGPSLNILPFFKACVVCFRESSVISARRPVQGTKQLLSLKVCFWTQLSFSGPQRVKSYQMRMSISYGLLSQSFSWKPLTHNLWHKIRVQIWCAVQVYGCRPWKIVPEPPAFSLVSSVDLVRAGVQQKEESFCFAWFSCSCSWSWSCSCSWWCCLEFRSCKWIDCIMKDLRFFSVFSCQSTESIFEWRITANDSSHLPSGTTGLLFAWGFSTDCRMRTYMYDDGVEHIFHQYLGNPANFLHFLHTSGQTCFFVWKIHFLSKKTIFSMAMKMMLTSKPALLFWHFRMLMIVLVFQWSNRASYE